MIEGLLVLALTVITPLAMRIGGPTADRRTGLRLALVGVLASGSFLLPDGAWAAAGALPWLAAVLVIATYRLRKLDLRSAGELVEFVPLVYLAMGGVWLITSRFGARPLGFGDDIVELTAVHFHYAGFVAPTIMLQLHKWLEINAVKRATFARAALLSVLAATPLTAAGLTFHPSLSLIGAILFGIGLTTGAVMTLALVVPKAQKRSRLLLGISALSVVVSMILAVAYALGQWVGSPALSIPTMARTHGLLNALGFSLAGLLGWIVTQARS